MSKFNEFKPRLKKLVSIERWLKSRKIEYNFKKNQPYLSRGLNLSHDSNSLNSASDISSSETKFNEFEPPSAGLILNHPFKSLTLNRWFKFEPTVGIVLRRSSH